MSWMETIEIRASEHDHEQLKRYLARITQSVAQTDGPQVRLYRHGRFSSDYCILILHPGTRINPSESDYALNLIQGLRHQGLINYSMWLPMHEADTKGE